MYSSDRDELEQKINKLFHRKFPSRQRRNQFIWGDQYESKELRRILYDKKWEEVIPIFEEQPYLFNGLDWVNK